MWEGTQQTMVLTQWRDIGGSASRKSNLLDGVLLSMSPINTWMFEASGKLLHANNKAAQMLQNAGRIWPFCVACIMAMLSRVMLT